MSDDLRSLKILIHGDYGEGKSRLGATTPAPRLIIDAEGGSEFVPGSKTYWDNPSDPPPDMSGSGTCIVRVANTRDLNNVYQWLQRGRHPFISVTIDSLSELQKRLVDEIAGTEQLSPQDWGSVFRRGEALVRQFRDLVYSPVKPMLCVCYLTGSVERGRAEVRVGPYVQGQLGSTLPGFVDIVGLLRTEDTDKGERRLLYVHAKRGRTEVEGERGKMTSVPWRTVAKDRTDCFPRGVIDITVEDGKEPVTIETMMRHITKTLNDREEQAS